ncbi:HTH domain-containing protein [Nanoarchaeota archaeon]
MTRKWKDSIIELLKQNSEGMTISDISQECNISRQTVSLVLAELQGGNKIRIRRVAAAKLHYWVE